MSLKYKKNKRRFFNTIIFIFHSAPTKNKTPHCIFLFFSLSDLISEKKCTCFHFAAGQRSSLGIFSIHVVKGLRSEKENTKGKKNVLLGNFSIYVFVNRSTPLD